MMPNLLKRLRLLEAWRKPAGPTPKEKMPNTYKTVKEAADALETLMDHAEALRGHLHFAVKLLEPWAGGTAQIEAMKTQLAAFRAAFPGEG